MDVILEGQVELGKILFILVMIALTNFVDTTAYAARLSGISTGKLAIANSLYSMLTFGSRTTTLLYMAPIGGIIDRAITNKFDPFFILLFVVLGAALGTASAIFMMPTTVNFYKLGINKMDTNQTALRIFKSIFFSKNGLLELSKCWRRPTLEMWKKISLKGIPKHIIIMNAILYSLFTVGSIAAYYAAWINPEYMARAASLSPAINALSAFLLLFLVDPYAAIVIDRGLNKKMSFDTVKSIMVYLSISRLCGTLIAVAMLYPGALFIGFVARFL